MKQIATWLVVTSVLVLVGAADASVLCVKQRKDGSLKGAAIVRSVCKPGEVQLTPDAVGFCCGASTTTTTTTTCATVTTGTLGIQDCGPAGGSCFGLCSNARECVPDTDGQCACIGRELTCGFVTRNETCGGLCPPGQTCQLHAPTLPDGCPGEPRCACVFGP